MDIRQLRTILAIAETGSLTRAAELLHIVQPALSRQLRQLEDELGAQLFERNRLGMELTEPGRRFLDQVRSSLQTLDRAKADILTSASGLSGTVAIGLLPSLASALAAPLVTSLRRQYPDLRVRIATGFTHALKDWLEHGVVDICLMGDYQHSDLLDARPVFRESLHIVGLPGSGLRPDEPVTLASAAHMPLIVPAGSQGLRHLIDRACTIIGTHLNVVAESDDTTIQLELIERGVGFAVLPIVAFASALIAGKVSAAPVIKPELHRTVIVCHPVFKKNSQAASVLEAELMKHLRPLADALKPTGLEWLAD